MPLNFDKHAQKGNQLLNELASELGEKADKQNAGRILRAVFHTLRNHLTLEENFQLLAQLPMALKGAYVDGWSPTKRQLIKSKKKSNFLSEVVREEGNSSWRDFSNGEEIDHSVKAVFKVLKKYISKGEFEDMIAVLPKELKQLIRDSIFAKKLTVELVSETPTKNQIKS